MFGQLLYSGVAYSRGMQVFLFFVTASEKLIFGYVMTNIILTLFNEKASIKQKFLYSFCTIILLNTAVVYSAYIINGFRSLSPFLLLVTTIPNPFLSLASYFCCIKILKLSKYRAIHLVVMFYLYSLIYKALTRAISVAFFAQQPGAYNYLLDVLTMFAAMVLNIICYWVVLILIKRFNLGIKLSERLFIKSIHRRLVSGFFINCLAYILMVIVHLVFNEEPLIYLYTAIFLLMCLITGYYRTLTQANKLELQNKIEHIETLTDSIDEFNGIKHDFYNILQTYSGYIEVGNLSKLKMYHEELLNTTVNLGEQLELNKKIEDNPTLIALLLEKQKYAEKLNVNIRFSISCEIKDLYVDSMSLCRSLACLLDNAIEAAAESMEKMVVFSISEKKNGNMLIMLTNSIQEDVDINQIQLAGITTKINHTGLGLTQAKAILSKYGNCILQFQCYNQRFTAYVEICPL